MVGRAQVNDRLDPEDALSLDEETLDPNQHYRFVHPRNMAKRKAQGYEVVLRSATKVRLMSDDPNLKSSSADDLIKVGNTVLMSCDLKRFHERRRAVSRLAKDRLGSSEAKFQTEAKKRGVRSLTGEEGEKR